MLKKVGNVANKLKLSEAYKIHLIFHLSFLKPFHEDVIDVGKKQAWCEFSSIERLKRLLIIGL